MSRTPPATVVATRGHLAASHPPIFPAPLLVLLLQTWRRAFQERTDGSNCPQLLPSGSPARGCRLTTPWGRRCPSAGRPHVCSLAVLPCEAPPLRRTLETRIPASPAWSLGPSVSPTRGTARGCRTRAVLRRCKQGSQVAVVNCHGCGHATAKIIRSRTNETQRGILVVAKACVAPTSRGRGGMRRLCRRRHRAESRALGAAFYQSVFLQTGLVDNSMAWRIRDPWGVASTFSQPLCTSANSGACRL